MNWRVSTHPITISLLLHVIVIVFLFLFLKSKPTINYSQSIKISLTKSASQVSSIDSSGKFNANNIALPFPKSIQNNDALSKWTGKPNEKTNNHDLTSDLPDNPFDMEISSQEITSLIPKQSQTQIETGLNWNDMGESMVKNRPVLDVSSLQLKPLSKSLVIQFNIPSTGGYPDKIKGIETGDPELDSAIAKYLSSFIFFPSTSGDDYTLILNFQITFKRP